jgi:hypothetical protein
MNYECLFKFIIRGTTDFVRLADPKAGICKGNIQYFIKITQGKIGEEELKETFYQLLGGNIANYYRSPPVFLTNLFESHFLMFITQQGNPVIRLKFQLNIFQFPSFGLALNYLEVTTSAYQCCTRDFLRRPAPGSTLQWQGKVDEESDDDFEEQNSNVRITLAHDLEVSY